jgi:hypothetical protein
LYQPINPGLRLRDGGFCLPLGLDTAWSAVALASQLPLH